MAAPYNAPILDHLISRQGSYKGHGTNFEGHSFTATLDLRPQVSGHLIELIFRATDEDSAFHEEITWISMDLMENKAALWTVSTNTPGVLVHQLVEDTSDDLRERRLVFRLGQPDNQHSFRQEITLDLMRDGRLEYRYAWGVPHEPFASRTRAVLSPL